MVVVKEVSAKIVRDSRGDKTIFVSIGTDVGKFSASSPTGKSTGKYEAKPYKKTIEKDIQTLEKFSEYFSDEIIDTFDDLKRIEYTVEGHIGANTIFALESAVLKALAKEKKKEIWQLINPKAKNFPRLVGNCVGGGAHSNSKKKPDFQEFLLIPKTNNVKRAFDENKKSKEDVVDFLKEKDKKFSNEENDENAWMTSLNEKEVLEILKNLDVPIGLDVAASEFYKRKKYHYQNPLLQRTKEEQFLYLSNLIKNFDLFYIEDPFEEEDFESHAKLLEKCKNSLIVGDDLIVTNYKRLKKAIELKSINALIVKPNQNGSLVEVKKICEMAKENGIKLVFSHRSGETEENILADLAFGFEADFIKTGITGKERESKIKRLIEIQESLA